MAIYTSYFANWRNFPANSIIASIAQYPPKVGVDIQFNFLAPNSNILKQYKQNLIDENQYIQLYIKQLNQLNKQIVINELNKYSINQILILCCYEKSDSFCHRHILRNWLNNDTNLNIQELKIKKLGEK